MFRFVSSQKDKGIHFRHIRAERWSKRSIWGLLAKLVVILILIKYLISLSTN